MTDRLRRLEALCAEMHDFAKPRDAGKTPLAPRVAEPRALEAELLLLAQGLAQGTQRVTGYPYRAPGGLSQAGKRLDAFLRPLGHTIDHTDIDRRYAYSTDLVPWFPGKAAVGGHDLKPSAEETGACWSWFEQEVQIVEPRVVVLLGREAAHSFLSRYAPEAGATRTARLESLSGRLFASTVAAGRELPAIVIWHPSSAWGRFAEPAARTYAAALDALKPLVFGKAGIPRTELDALYEDVRAEHVERDLDSLQAAQLAMARRCLDDPASLAAAFGRSVETFSFYSNSDEPFHPPRRDPELPGYGDSDQIGGTSEFAAKLKIQTRIESGGLSFEYVDREVWPARTTGGVKFADGRSARSAPRLDLLLADTEDRTPVVAEVKVRGDQHPFYALIQLLMLAAQLATDPQLARLEKWYPGRFEVGERRIDLCILLADNPDKGTYRPRLFAITEELSGRLLEYEEVASRIRRISCLDVRLEGGQLIAERRFCHER